MKPIKDISKGNEDIRRGVLIDISRAKDNRYIPQLIARLNSNETYENKRHIIRALGNIGDNSVADFLLELLSKEKGLILSEIAETLGKFKHHKAKEKLNELVTCEISQVAEKSKWALNKIKGPT